MPNDTPLVTLSRHHVTLAGSELISSGLAPKVWVTGTSILLLDGGQKMDCRVQVGRWRTFAPDASDFPSIHSHPDDWFFNGYVEGGHMTWAAITNRNLWGIIRKQRSDGTLVKRNNTQTGTEFAVVQWSECPDILPRLRTPPKAKQVQEDLLGLFND